MSVARPAIAALAVIAASGAAAASPNLYDWIAPAPIVVTGERVGAVDRTVEIRVRDVLRGEVGSGATILVELRRANRGRDRDLHPGAAELKAGVLYALLLEPDSLRKLGAPPAYQLVRGVQGVRELPAEGAEPLVQALGVLVGIQAEPDDRQSWVAIRGLLERNDPLLVETALDLHLKFLRGDVMLIETLRPLFEHPAPTIRERTLALVGQVLHGRRTEAVGEPATLRDELAARARRDPSQAVRLAAVRALDGLEGPEVLTLLDQVADDDPDQDVRLLAEALALERRRGRRPAAVQD